MHFLKKFFAQKNLVEEIRLLYDRKEWSAVVAQAKDLDLDTLDKSVVAELEGLINTARDALAKANLQEGLWAHQSGNLLRAREDFLLALEQAVSVSLQEQIKRSLDTLENGDDPQPHPLPAENPVAAASACNGCSPQESPRTETEEHLDEATRMDLLLATMPADLAERYQSCSPEFRKAWLAAQDGDDLLAQRLLSQIPPSEHNALFFFERGALLVRSGNLNPAFEDLQAALTEDPDLFPAFDALSDALASSGKVEQFETLLKQNISAGRFSGYCWARLAELHAQRKELELALTAGLKAIDEGITDTGLIVLCGQILERENRLDEAEALMQLLPAGGGCSGGVHPLLAEYWLRQEKNLNAALESFKGALRQDRENPRWRLRIAQVYLAKGWHKEASEHIESLMKTGGMTDHMREEVQAVADQLRT